MEMPTVSNLKESNERFELLLKKYQDVCDNVVTDMQKHMPKLRELASECKHVTEFGARFNISTLALLAGKPNKVISWDLSPSACYEGWMRLCGGLPTNLVDPPHLELRTGNTLEITIEETDMLFIDTYHTYEQLKAELERHGDKARKYLVFHDTWTFGYFGEDGSKPGLRQAIKEFQLEHGNGLRWTLIHDEKDCNGLVVLQRRPGYDLGVPPPFCLMMN